MRNGRVKRWRMYSKQLEVKPHERCCQIVLMGVDGHPVLHIGERGPQLHGGEAVIFS
jgi:hypothetical protein